MQIRAVVLAAGKGSRMNSPLPKVLHEVAGKPMITRLLGTLREARVAASVVVVGYEAARVRKAAACSSCSAIPLRCRSRFPAGAP